MASSTSCGNGIAIPDCALMWIMASGTVKIQFVVTRSNKLIPLFMMANETATGIDWAGIAAVMTGATQESDVIAGGTGCLHSSIYIQSANTGGSNFEVKDFIENLIWH